MAFIDEYLKKNFRTIMFYMIFTNQYKVVRTVYYNHSDHIWTAS